MVWWRYVLLLYRPPILIDHNWLLSALSVPVHYVASHTLSRYQGCVRPNNRVLTRYVHRTLQRAQLVCSSRRIVIEERLKMSKCLECDLARNNQPTS